MLTLESFQTKGKAQMRPPVQTLHQTAEMKCLTWMTYRTWTNQPQQKQSGFSTGTTSAGGAASAASQYVHCADMSVGSPTGDEKGKGFGTFGRGIGSGKGSSNFRRRRRTVYPVTVDEMTAYLNQKGKGRSRATTGKGHGRKRNPRGRDGQVMKCRECGSEEHFAARCPTGKGAGQGG